MPTGKDSQMLTFVVPKELLARIDDYRFEHRFRSRAAAIKWPLEWALAQNPQPSTNREARP